MEPRIYTYKITFPNQGWWYWGVHKERKYGEDYWGSPSTHKNKWDWFEFEKQILEFFDDWDEARKVEKRLIDPDLNNQQCLNENSVGGFSLESNSKGSKSQSWEHKSKAGKVGGKIGGKIGGRTQGKRNVESGQLASIQSKGGKATAKIVNIQKWECLVTGYISNPGGLSRYQNSRGIDTELRRKLK